MKWPPVLHDAALPAWVIARDVLATLLAWWVLLYFVQDALWMLAYWLGSAVGIPIRPQWTPGEMLRDLKPFLEMVVLLVVWLLMFAILRWRLLTNRASSWRQPDPLDPARHAAVFALTVAGLQNLQARKTAIFSLKRGRLRPTSDD